jgi:hypothetical protein
VLMCGFAVAVWHLSRPGRTLTWRETLLGGCVCGLCAFTKPGVLFAPLAAGFAAIILISREHALTKRLVHVAAFTVLLVLPSFVYVALVLNGRGGELMPGLLLEAWYYQGVEKMVARAVGHPALALGLYGACLAVRAGDRLLVGLLAGYVGYLGIFTYHAATHDYYHAPLMVPVALGLGWAAARLRTCVRLAVFAVIAVAGYLLVASLMQAPRADVAAARQQRDANYRTAREVVGPGANVIALTEEHGYPLEMQTWLRVVSWPPRHDIPIMVRAGVLPAGFTPDSHVANHVADGCTFAVVTDFAEFDRQPELRAALEKRGRLVVNEPGLLVYDLR